MSIHVLKNDFLTLQIDELGAEMISICDHNTNTEYLWNADPAYWKRHAPILFPFVGTLKNKSFSYQGTTYSVMQHGFARDMEFTILQQNPKEIWFQLKSNTETLKLYPFPFCLELGYQLQDRKITCLWRVINTGNDIMHFSIGGHPAFNCPINPQEKQSDYYFSFDTKDPIRYLQVNENGLLIRKFHDEQNILTTEQGILPLDPHMFDHDALIIEDHQCHQVSLLTPDKQPFVTVSFDAPLFGLWTPVKKDAPFICIEPWYGRCDAEDFNGALEEREYSNSLEAGKVFETSYTIEIS